MEREFVTHSKMDYIVKEGFVDLLHHVGLFYEMHSWLFNT